MATKKPTWIVEKERQKRAEDALTVWLFGIHAVRDALLNPKRELLKLVVTKNAADRLADAIEQSGITPEICEPRKFSAPLDAGSVHQGAALEVKPLRWTDLQSIAIDAGPHGRLLFLDRVTDPHNVGAILRSAEVLGAAAVIATKRNAAPETGALAKTASGALERQPYVRIRNLADTMEEMKALGYILLGLDGEAEDTMETVIASTLANGPRPIALVLGAEGPGLRDKTKATCDALMRIDSAGAFGSLNVSNAAAVSLYASLQNKSV